MFNDCVNMSFKTFVYSILTLYNMLCIPYLASTLLKKIYERFFLSTHTTPFNYKSLIVKQVVHVTKY